MGGKQVPTDEGMAPARLRAFCGWHRRRQGLRATAPGRQVSHGGTGAGLQR